MSDLWTVVVYLGDQGHPQVNLVFSSESAALDVFAALEGTSPIDGMPLADDCRLTVTDNFGTTLRCDPRDALAVLLQDTGRSAEAGIELGLLQARSQAKAQNRVQADPMLSKPQLARPMMFGPPPGKAS